MDTTKIYIDIDSLLDLRQAVLSRLMSLDQLTTYLQSEDYNFRTIDKFPIDMNQYSKINQDKASSLLSRSSLTYIINSLRSKIDHVEKRNTFHNKHFPPEILLNVYPFKLHDDQVKIIQNLLFVKLKTSCHITIVSMSTKELTPHYINSNNIVSVFMYQFNEWLSIHTDSLNQTKLTETLFYFPALYQTEDTKNELEEIKKSGFKDIFSYIEFLYSSVLNVNFLPVVFYSNLITSSAYIEKLEKVDLGDKNGHSSDTV